VDRDPVVVVDAPQEPPHVPQELEVELVLIELVVRNVALLELLVEAVEVVAGVGVEVVGAMEVVGEVGVMGEVEVVGVVEEVGEVEDVGEVEVVGVVEEVGEVEMTTGVADVDVRGVRLTTP